MIALFIDWNELSMFEQMVPMFKQAILAKIYRVGGFYCISAICGKGMPEDKKIQIIKDLGYLEILDSVKCEYKQFSFDLDEDD